MIVFAPHPGSGASSAPGGDPAIAALSRQAERVIRVLVTDVRGQWDTTPDGHRVIHTYVTCKVASALKGPQSDTLTLRLLGGRVGKARMEVLEVPEFAVGEESVLFIAGNGRVFCPVVGGEAGRYRIVRSGAGTCAVQRPDGGPAGSVDEFERQIELQLKAKS